MRVLALSDVHVDFEQNRDWLARISNLDHLQDVLLLAGDVTDKLDLLERTLENLRRKFAQLFFVPGNHELWDRERKFGDAIAKFEHVLERCAALDVHTEPRVIDGVRIVPLFSWYARPEDGLDSLFLEKASEDMSLTAWADDYFVRWPEFKNGGGAAAHFLARNETRLQRNDDLPTVSFSHFLPRRDLMMRATAEIEREGPGIPDPNPHFNFSRVAGTQELDRQIRRLWPAVHVYGHQHRNRWREVDGILYVSHCLGYPTEGRRTPSADVGGPRVVWET
jgi:predicted phosphodiesterase